MQEWASIDDVSKLCVDVTGSVVAQFAAAVDERVVVVGLDYPECTCSYCHLRIKRGFQPYARNARNASNARSKHASQEKHNMF